MSQYQLQLAFLPLIDQEWEFTVYRRPVDMAQGEAVEHQQRQWRLPESLSDPPPEDPIYAPYHVTFGPSEGFEPFRCGHDTNIYVSLAFLHHCLQIVCGRLPTTSWMSGRQRFRNVTDFVLKRDNEGIEVVWLEPYFLRSTRELGFLLDYRFQPTDGVPTHRILERSLSIKNGDSNRDYYADRYDKIQMFISAFHPRIEQLSEAPPVAIDHSLRVLDAESLAARNYVFNNGARGKSQFLGVRQNGPLSPAPDSGHIVFVYRPYEKPLSHDLFRALRGDTFKTFSGMESMFHCQLDGSRVSGEPVDSFEPDVLDRLCCRIKDRHADKDPVVPVALVPFDRHGGDDANRQYHAAKHVFLRHHLPSQFVSLRTLQDRNALKWAISSIGLQLFAKLGGQPWKVDPKHSSALIIGLGQAHEVRDGNVARFFGYSVLTDSSGIYAEARVLGAATNQEEYHATFRERLRSVLQDYAGQYERFVIHATFTIRKAELDIVRRVLDDLRWEDGETVPADRFIVLKFNDRNRFFAFAFRNNSKVPFESSILRLSRYESLVWFEGLQWHNPNVFKQIERPVHVQLAYPDPRNVELPDSVFTSLLQDAVNLSGANWRGFNAKSLPVSVFYASLIAKYFKNFQSLGLEDVDISAIRPWFL